MELNFKGTRIAVTGGCGFIGSHLVRRLCTLGATVLVLKSENDPCDRLHRDLEGVTIASCSFSDTDTLKKNLEMFLPDYVAHVKASINKNSSSSFVEEMIDTNVLETTRVLNAVKGVPSIKRIVGLGSIEECAGGEPPFHEKSCDAPLSPYSLSKLLSTKVMQYFFSQENLPTVVLRLSVVYGPAQREGMFIPDLIVSCLAGADVPMTEGKQMRDFIFVDDAVEAILASFITDGIEGEIFHIGSGESRTLRETAKRIHTLTKHRGRLLFGAIPERDRESMQYKVEVKKARKQLNWKPKMSLEEGLRRTIDWYKKQKASETIDIHV